MKDHKVLFIRRKQFSAHGVALSTVESRCCTLPPLSTWGVLNDFMTLGFLGSERV